MNGTGNTTPMDKAFTLTLFSHTHTHTHSWTMGEKPKLRMSSFHTERNIENNKKVNVDFLACSF